MSEETPPMSPEEIQMRLVEIDEERQRMLKDSEPEKGTFEGLKNLGQLNWLTQSPPARKYLFSTEGTNGDRKGFLPAGKMCMIVSPGGCGKTFLLTHCALAAATGTKWIHTKADKPIKVLFVAAEEDESELWIRFHNMVKSLRFQNQPHLMELACNNIIPFASRSISQRLIDERGEPQKFYTELKEFLEANEDIKLVILDPASRFMGPETETNNAAATDFVNLIDGLTMAGGKPTVIIAHHTNKTALAPVAEDKLPSFSQGFSRGSSALIDGCRWMMGLQRSNAQEAHRSIFIKVLKSNYSELSKVLEFEQDYANSGILKYIGEASEKTLKTKKVDEAWKAAKQGQTNKENAGLSSVLGIGEY